MVGQADPLTLAATALGQRDFRRAHALCIDVLQQRPDDAEALFLLGVLAAEHGQHAKAVELYGRSLMQRPASAETLAQLGRSRIALQQPRLALEAARAALALRPGAAPVLDTLGVVLTRAGAHDEAVTPFRAAVAATPTNPEYQYNLGAALQFIGDFRGAEAAYRAALAVLPSHHRAWSALAQVAPRLAPADVAAIEAQLAVDSLSPDAELQLCHARAKSAEDAGDCIAAMRWLQRGKARKRAALDAPPPDEDALFAAAQRTAALATRGGGHASAEPIFIVGMPRTGTTLVERILSSHPDVFAAGELGHFALALKRAAGTPSPFVLDAATLDAAQGLDLAAVGAAYLDSTRPRTGHTPRFIDKMPLNVLLAGVIATALPEARIVCLKRHPLDTCLSNYRQLFATGFSYYHYAYDLIDTGRWWQRFDALTRVWREQLGGHYIEVHYEDVVDDLEGQARRLLALCGLDWHPACIDFHRNAAPVATASAVQVRQPLYRSALGRWQRYGAALDPLRALLADDLARWDAERGAGHASR